MTDITDAQMGELHFFAESGVYVGAQELWQGQFGAEYTARNRVDWRKRIPFWTRILNQTGARSAHEMGCNAGWNLSAIRRALPDVEVSGHDLNAVAVDQANGAGLSAWVSDRMPVNRIFDLTFTSGVLIHVPPAILTETMDQIVRASGQYVLAIEYAAEREEEVLYRGQTGALWKRPFGRLYEAMGMKLVHQESLSHADGFDHCSAWLLTK